MNCNNVDEEQNFEEYEKYIRYINNNPIKWFEDMMGIRLKWYEKIWCSIMFKWEIWLDKIKYRK